MEFVVSGVGEGSVEVPRDGEASNDDGDNAGQIESSESSRKRKRQDEALDDNQVEPAKNIVYSTITRNRYYPPSEPTFSHAFTSTQKLSWLYGLSKAELIDLVLDAEKQVQGGLQVWSSGLVREIEEMKKERDRVGDELKRLRGETMKEGDYILGGQSQGVSAPGKEVLESSDQEASRSNATVTYHPPNQGHITFNVTPTATPPLPFRKSEAANFNGDAGTLKSYEDMIVEGLEDINDPNGTPPKLLFEWISDHYPVLANFRPSASQALNKAYKKGRLLKLDGSLYKINLDWDPSMAPQVKKATRKPKIGHEYASFPRSNSPSTTAPAMGLSVTQKPPDPHRTSTPHPGSRASPEQLPGASHQPTRSATSGSTANTTAGSGRRGRTAGLQHGDIPVPQISTSSGRNSEAAFNTKILATLLANTLTNLNNPGAQGASSSALGNSLSSTQPVQQQASGSSSTSPDNTTTGLSKNQLEHIAKELEKISESDTSSSSGKQKDGSGERREEKGKEREVELDPNVDPALYHI